MTLNGTCLSRCNKLECSKGETKPKVTLPTINILLKTSFDETEQRLLTTFLSALQNPTFHIFNLLKQNDEIGVTRYWTATF